MHSFEVHSNESACRKSGCLGLEEVPCVLTGFKHIGGTKLFMVHLYLWKHNFSEKIPDQLCQAVIQSRLLKPVKSSKYLTILKLFHQNVTLNGIDTCSSTSFIKFNFKSILSEETKSRAIKNRPDIDVRSRKLRQENIIYEYFYSGKRSFSNCFSSTIDYLKYTKGAIFVSLEERMIFQDKMKNIQIQVLLDHR